jgi:nitrous oxide reductase
MSPQTIIVVSLIHLPVLSAAALAGWGQNGYGQAAMTTRRDREDCATGERNAR